MAKNKFKESYKETMARYQQELQQGCRIDIRTGKCVPLTQKEIQYRLGFLQSKKMNADEKAFFSGVNEGKKAHRRSIRNGKFYNNGGNPDYMPNTIFNEIYMD